MHIARFPPGNEYSVLTAPSENMYHDRGGTGPSHYCKLVLSSAWSFWVRTEFPLRRRTERSPAAWARGQAAPGKPVASYGFAI